jgi:hypothetical protein
MRRNCHNRQAAVRLMPAFRNRSAARCRRGRSFRYGLVSALLSRLLAGAEGELIEIQRRPAIIAAAIIKAAAAQIGPSLSVALPSRPNVALFRLIRQLHAGFCSQEPVAPTCHPGLGRRRHIGDLMREV